MSMVLYVRRATDAQLDEVRGNPASITDFFFSTDAHEAGDLIDFDRAWDALNMMLTGEPFGSEGPLAIFYYNGEEVGSDAGYGPARYIPIEKMREFAAALQDLSDEDLASRFDPEGFEAAQLYSSYLFSEDGVEVDYIMQGMPGLRDFADKCTETNSGALVAIY
ncbi:MAG: YfbM family protein [Novosphingobium sp.]|nr:YfbM family protein [Novosphingobium sp.]